MSEQEIFIAAMARPNPADRRRFLDEVCAGNDVLRERIETLIRQSDQLGSFLEHAPQTAATTDISEVVEQPGTQIGPYKLVQQIGEGGMGLVFVAEQHEPVRRKVALKLIKPGMDSRNVIARFEAERQALALMDHPNIARVLDGGTTASGRPYFVMELVKGVPITRYCDEHHLTPRQRLELFVPVCQAIQHAHQKGVIHRDIKPSNVLIALYDGKPVPKVIDFGVAKATGQSLTDKTLVTGFGAIVGTLEYMSPEQAEINQLDIDTRSDIYSLGVLLYELLTGSTPFSRKEPDQAGMLEMLRVIREEEPSKPSNKLSTAEGLPTLAANRGTDPARLTKLVRGELDWIVMKALEKDRSRRYATANGFAIDLQSYLADEPVQACPPSAAYRFGKFARRNRGPLAIASVALFSVLLALVGLSISNVIITQEKNLKVAALDQANTQKGIAQRNATKAREQERIAVSNEKRAKASEQLANRRYYAAQMNLAIQAWRAGEAPRVLELLEGQRPKPGAEDLRGFEWFYLWRLVNGGSRHLQGHTDAVMDLEFSPDGKTLASASWDWTVRLWDPVSLRQQQVLTGHSPWHLAFSPDGKLLAGGSTFESKNPLWNLQTGERLTTLPGAISGLEFSPGGATLLGGGESARIWDVPSAAQRAAFDQLGFLIGVFPDGKTAATLSSGDGEDGGVHFWDTESGAIKRTILVRWPVAAALSADGSRLAVSAESKVKIWDTATGKLLTTHSLPADVRCLDFSPDGKQLAAGGEDRRVVVWDVETGKRLREDVHRDIVWTVAYSPDGKTLASGSLGGAVKLRDLQAVDEATIVPIAGVGRVQFRRDGKTLLAGGRGPTSIIDVALGKEVAILPAEKIGAFSATGDVAGEIWASTGEAGVWDLPSGREIARFTPPESGKTPRLSISHDGKFAATSFAWGADRTVRVWELATRQTRLLTVEPKPWHLQAVQCAEFSPDGKLLAAGYHFQWVVVWNLQTGQEKMRFEQKPAMLVIQSLKFSPDSKSLAVGTDIGAVSLWDMDTSQRVADFRGHTANITSLAFTPDGEVLATAGADKSVKLWDARTGQERCTLIGHSGSITSVQFSPDGQTLATASGRDGTVRLWHAATDSIALWPRQAAISNEPAFPLPVGAVELTEAGLREGLRQRPDDAAIRQRLVRLLQTQGQLDEAAKLLADVVHAGADQFQKLLELAAILRQQQKYDDAAQALHEAVRLDPQRSEPHNSLGWILEKQGRYVEAEAAFREAIRLKSDFAGTHHGLGRVLRAQKKFAEASEAFREAIRLVPDDPGVHLALGWTLHDDRRFPEAELAFQTAVRLAPHMASAQYGLGDSLFLQKKFAEAIGPLREALRLDSKRAYIHGKLGRAFLEQQLLSEAEVEFSEQIRLTPEQPSGHYALGKVLQMQKNFAKSEAPLREAIRLAPTDPGCYRALGWTLVELKRYVEAETSYREAVRLAPENAEDQHGLGRALVGQKRFGEAETAAREALRLDPQHHWAPELLKRALDGQKTRDPASKTTVEQPPAAAASEKHRSGEARPSIESEERIDALVRQLGNVEFQMRQAASQELVIISEPALPALRKAAANDADPEIRWRAAQAIRTVAALTRAAATKKALEELQGSWTLVSSEAGGKQTGGEVKSYIFSFQGEKWSIHAGGRLSQGGTVTRIEVKEKLNAIDLAITEGANAGVTAISIYAVEGNTLKYINSGEPRATEFVTKPGDGRGYQIFRRASAEP